MLRRKLQFLVLLVTVCVLISSSVVFATPSPPSIPLLVYGSVNINGQLAPIDTEISAEIEGVEVAVATMVDEGKYMIKVPDGKANEGKTIVFKVNGIADDSNQSECVNIDDTPCVRFDLAVTVESPNSSPDEGSREGGGGSSSDTPENETIQGDINEDGKIDKYDFALMMAAWGQTGSNDSDINGDNKIDKYDFALLMLNWSGT